MSLTQPIGLDRTGDAARNGGPTPTHDGNGKLSPMLEQYIEIKANNPDSLLFYRMGDFYELFFEDAEMASRALGIVLTKRGKHQGQDIPMCGVPIHRSDEYLHRLIALGHRVAVCEQLEDPAEAKKRGYKSVVRRDVVRLVTPGTLTEDTLLDARRNNYLLAIARARLSSVESEARFGLAWIDISTGEFRITECDRVSLPAEIARLEPSEILVSDALYADADLVPTWRELPAVTPLTRDVFDGATAERRLTVVLRGRDQRSLRPAVAAGTDRRRGLRHLCRAHADRQASAAVAAVARGGLGDDGDRPGDARQSRTDAHAVRRAARLAARLHRPHRDLGRLAPAGAAAGGAADRREGDCARGSMRWRASSMTSARAPRRASRLQAAPDLARALSRIALQRGGPRDLAAIRDGVVAASDLAASLGKLKDIPAEIAEALTLCRKPDATLGRRTGRARSATNCR